MKQRIKQILSRRTTQYILNSGLTPSAVLIPIYNKDGECCVLFTKRTQALKNHKGQISFPGGAYDNSDRSLLDTALRECTEEIGLNPEDVEILGELDDFVTEVSSYVISPFVAAIPWPYQFDVSHDEVEELIEVPIKALLDIGNMSLETRTVDGSEFTSYFYHYQNRVIWGATARILHQFIDILQQDMDLTT